MRPVLWFVLPLLAVPFFSAHARLERPDIIVIVTDNQRPETLPFMRHTTRLLVDGGVNFTRAFASTALCCPARATLLKGVYSHNHGVLADGADYVRQFRDDSTLATWLSNAGYQTALFGKYLSPYNPDVFQPWPYVPPGWDNWRVFGGQYYGYKIVGPEDWYRHRGRGPEDYQTTVLTEHVVEFMETQAVSPYFLYVAPFAPHDPATPAPEDRDTFKDLPPWRPPSYNEADVSDKPEWVRDLPLLSPTQQREGNKFRRRQLEALQAVDRLVRAIVDVPRRKNALSRTVIVFTSDNGLAWGEHRWLDRKDCVYDVCSRVPLMVRVPGVTPHTEDAVVGNIDLAPSIAEWAKVSIPDKVNGRSLAGLIADPGSSWRRGLLLESLAGRGLAKYQGVRTDRYVYVEYRSGERELYDLRVDPDQLTNVVTDPDYADKVAQLKVMLDRLRDR